MKPEITTNIKWYLATEKPVPDDVYRVVAFMTLNYITTLSVHQGHFNCSSTNDFGGKNEFKPGEDVLYWSYLPNSLTAAANKYEKQHSKND